MNNNQQLFLSDFFLSQVTTVMQSPSEKDNTAAVTELPSHPYLEMLRRLGIPEEALPEPSDKEAVLKAMLDGIGESAEYFDSVLLDTDITKSDLLSAGSLGERKRLYR